MHLLRTLRLAFPAFALLLLLAAGCSDGSSAKGPGDGSPGGAGGEAGGGEGGGEGGAGGSGGSDEGPGGAGGEEPPPPPWDDLELSLLWRHQGFGEVWDLAVGDFLGTGEEQIAVGGRRPAILRPDGSEVVWFQDWEQDENLLRGGDNDWVYTLGAIPNEEGSDDLLVSHSMGGAMLLSGRDGSTLWSIPRIDQRFPFPHVVLFGDPEAPSFFPRWGRAAYSVRTGELLWENPRASDPAAFVIPARRGADAPTGLFLVSEGEELLGFPGSGGAWRRYPSVAALSADGEELFVVELRDGDDGIQPTRAAAADLDGEGVDSLIVTLHGEPTRAYDSAGELRWEAVWLPWGNDPSRTRIRDVLAWDLDGDGRDEIILVAYDSNGLGTETGDAAIQILDWEGRELMQLDFNLPVVSTRILEVDEGAPILLLGTGTTELPHFGHLVGVRLDLEGVPDFSALQEFELRIPAQAKALAVLEEGDEPTVIIGTDDGVLWAANLRGEAVWNHHLGSFFNAIASIPGGEGEDWIAFGDNAGTLAFLNPAGEKVWHRFMEVGTHGSVVAVAPARLEPGGDVVIAAAASAHTECCGGILEAYSLEGERFLERVLPGEALDMEAVDLDGDGVSEFVVLEGMTAANKVCRLRAFDAKGFFLWEVNIEACMLGSITAGEMDGSGRPSIGVRTHPVLIPATPTTLSVVSHEGELRWLHEEDFQTTNWIAASPLGLVGGGNTTENNGFVELRGTESDEVLWRTLLAPRPDPNHETNLVSGQTSHGMVFPRGESFGVALSNWANDVYLLDGATGDVLWSVFTETEENWLSARHRGGPVTYVPRTEATPPYLFFGQWDSSRRRSEAMVISMDGEIIRRAPILSPASRLALVEKGSGIPSVAVQALLGIYSFELGETASE